MTGVVLAGGEGMRLRPTTEFYNKHMALVYDRPMIYYPLETLGRMGCWDAVIVSSPEGLVDMARVIQDGRKFMPGGVRYMVQQEPKGAADALAQTEGVMSSRVDRGVFPVLCGDVYFDPPLERRDKPTLFWNEFEKGHLHSVWNPETDEIVEKPLRDIGKRAIVAYYYDDRVFDAIRNLKPSKSGELELVDLHRFYLGNGADIVEHKGFFGDMGTPDGLLRVANHIADKK